MKRSFFSYFRQVRVLTSENRSAIGIVGSLGGKDYHGTATPAGDTVADEPEVVWRLTIWGRTLEPAYVLRQGEFQELGEVVEWKRRSHVANALETARQQWKWARKPNRSHA